MNARVIYTNIVIIIFHLHGRQRLINKVQYESTTLLNEGKRKKFSEGKEMGIKR